MWMIENEMHAKAHWRAFCAAFLGWMQVALRRAPRAPGLAVVLVEFRTVCTEAVTFVLLQALRQLGRVPVHVVCGQENHNRLAAALRPFRPWAASIRLHTAGGSVDRGVRHYNRLLLTPAFWELFPEDRLLVMQEDSCLFDGDLAPFLKYDYVGAPWVHTEENAHGVGNGGFSLRSRHAMLRVLRWLDGNFSQLSISHHTRRHWTDPKHPPEDVVFANALWRHPRLGALAPRAVAVQFAQEVAAAPPGVRGGHQWWLHTLRDFSRPYPLLAVLCRLFPVAVVASPYAFTVGGGEKYLSHLLHALTRDLALFPLVCTPTAPAGGRHAETFCARRAGGRALARLPWTPCLRTRRGAPGTSHCRRARAAPAHAGAHAQRGRAGRRPARATGRTASSIRQGNRRLVMETELAAYDRMVVNSEFTLGTRAGAARAGAAPAPGARVPAVRGPRRAAGAAVVCQQQGPAQLRHGGPPGAALPHGQQRCHHVAVRAFNALHKMGETAPSSPLWARAPTEWEAELRRASVPAHHAGVNASEKQKNACLRRAQTLLHLTGMEDTRPQNEEHFGIVLIEAMAAGCAAVLPEVSASGCRTPTWWTRRSAGAPPARPRPPPPLHISRLHAPGLRRCRAPAMLL